MTPRDPELGSRLVGAVPVLLFGRIRQEPGAEHTEQGCLLFIVIFVQRVRMVRVGSREPPALGYEGNHL